MKKKSTNLSKKSSTRPTTSATVKENTDDKKVIGSKYRFVKSTDDLFEPQTLIKKPKNDDTFDLSLYLEDVCEDSVLLEKKYLKRDDKY